MIRAYNATNTSAVTEVAAIRVAAHTFTFAGELICQLSQFQTAAARRSSLIWQQTATFVIHSDDNQSLLLLFVQGATPCKIL